MYGTRWAAFSLVGWCFDLQYARGCGCIRSCRSHRQLLLQCKPLHSIRTGPRGRSTADVVAGMVPPKGPERPSHHHGLLYRHLSITASSKRLRPLLFDDVSEDSEIGPTCAAPTPTQSMSRSSCCGQLRVVWLWGWSRCSAASSRNTKPSLTDTDYFSQRALQLSHDVACSTVS